MVTLPDKPIPREFVNLAGPAMLPHTSGILTAVLPCLAYEDEERRMVRGVSFSLKRQNGGADFSSLFSFFLILKSLPLWAERGGLCEWPIIMRKRMKVTVVVEGGKICVTKVCWYGQGVQSLKFRHLRLCT